MKAFLRFFSWLLPLLLLIGNSSCSVTRVIDYSQPLPSSYQQFVGHTIGEIIDVMGADFTQKTDGRGGSIYVWEKISTTTTGVADSRYGYYQNRYNYNQYTPGVQTSSNYVTTQHRNFVEVSVNSYGKVYRVNDSEPTLYATMPARRGWYRLSPYMKAFLGIYTAGTLPLIYGLKSNSKCKEWYSKQPEEVKRFLDRTYNCRFIK